jgi:hypothetical protein
MLGCDLLAEGAVFDETAASPSWEVIPAFGITDIAGDSTFTSRGSSATAVANQRTNQRLVGRTYSE